MSEPVERGFAALGVFGYLARALVFALIAYGVIKAAVNYTPRSAIGLDGALANFAHSSYGPALLGSSPRVWPASPCSRSSRRATERSDALPPRRRAQERGLLAVAAPHLLQGVDDLALADRRPRRLDQRRHQVLSGGGGGLDLGQPRRDHVAVPAGLDRFQRATCRRSQSGSIRSSGVWWWSPSRY